MLPEEFRLLSPIVNGPHLYFTVGLPGFKSSKVCAVTSAVDVVKHPNGLVEIESLVRRMDAKMEKFDAKFVDFVKKVTGLWPKHYHKLAQKVRERPKVWKRENRKEARKASRKWIKQIPSKRPPKGWKARSQANNINNEASNSDNEKSDSGESTDHEMKEADVSDEEDVICLGSGQQFGAGMDDLPEFEEVPGASTSNQMGIRFWEMPGSSSAPGRVVAPIVPFNNTPIGQYPIPLALTDKRFKRDQLPFHIQLIYALRAIDTSNFPQRTS